MNRNATLSSALKTPKFFTDSVTLVSNCLRISRYPGQLHFIRKWTSFSTSAWQSLHFLSWYAIFGLTSRRVSTAMIAKAEFSQCLPQLRILDLCQILLDWEWVFNSVIKVTKLCGVFDSISPIFCELCNKIFFVLLQHWFLYSRSWFGFSLCSLFLRSHI